MRVVARTGAECRTYGATGQGGGVCFAPPRSQERKLTSVVEATVDETRNPNCVFCRIIGGEETVSIIYENEEVIAFLDIQPLYPGHVLVAPKAHHKNLFYVPEALAAGTFGTARRILPGLARATGCRAVNLFSPNGADGGQNVFHFHLHLLPVPEGQPFPLQLPSASTPVPTRSELDVMAARISQSLQERFDPINPLAV